MAGVISESGPAVLTVRASQHEVAPQDFIEHNIIEDVSSNGCEAVEWIVSEFRFRKKEELELIATVDFAALDLTEQGAAITMENVKRIIATNTDWAPKLNREMLSDTKITEALSELRNLFPSTYA
jgi:hypothetical protein